MVFGLGNPPPGDGGGDGIVKDATTATFTADVIEASAEALILVDFWAAWCGPCKQLTPILEKVVRSYGGKVRLVKVDSEANQALTAQLRIQSLPTVYAFRDGRPLDGFMGALPESGVREFIDRLLGEDAGDDIANALAAGEQALEAGDLQSAAEIFASILREDQRNPKALAGLARCYLQSGDNERAQQTISLVYPKQQNDPAVQSVVAALALTSKAAASGPINELRARVESNPSDHTARYDLAVALAASGDKDEAVDHLLEIVKRERAWNEEAARKQLVELFDAWGPKDPATLEGRRRLSSLLFA